MDHVTELLKKYTHNYMLYVASVGGKDADSEARDLRYIEQIKQSLYEDITEIAGESKELKEYFWPEKL